VKINAKGFLLFLLLLLVFSLFLGASTGAVSISYKEIIGILARQAGIELGTGFEARQEAVLLTVRIPRVLFGLLIGAALGMSGAALQSLFRNPLADPGLIGISSGGTLAAVFVTVFGASLFPAVSKFLGFYTLPVASFIGAFAVTIAVFRFSQFAGRTMIATLLLAGIAINALTSSLTGFTIFYANDAQLRSITFWTLGSLGGATWSHVTAILPFILVPLLVLPRMSKALNAFALGESNAAHLGINTEKTKKYIIVLSALAVGASVAVAGIIGFVGLVVPHIVRLLIGPDNRYLLTASALLGSSLLILADLGSRTMMKSAELPIGILTCLLGAPLFMYILIRERKKQNIF
jgi:iron complex transport system permease protein